MIRGSSSGLRVFCGSATVMPCWRSGVTTMKMISSTSMMSTIGVTLISDANPPEPPPDIPIADSPFRKLIQTPSATRNQANRTLQTYVYIQLRLQLLGAVLDEVVDQLGSRIV